MSDIGSGVHSKLLSMGTMSEMRICNNKREKFVCLRELAPHCLSHPRPKTDEHHDEHQHSRLVIPRCREMLGDCTDDDYGGHQEPNSPLLRSGLSPSSFG